MGKKKGTPAMDLDDPEEVLNAEPDAQQNQQPDEANTSTKPKQPKAKKKKDAKKGKKVCMHASQGKHAGCAVHSTHSQQFSQSQRVVNKCLNMHACIRCSRKKGFGQWSQGFDSDDDDDKIQLPLAGGEDEEDMPMPSKPKPKGKAKAAPAK
eukprot:805829-Pelagomonas_calceolata.AAC.3